MKRTAAMLAVSLAAACVLRDDPPPPLIGPSELAQSVRVSASPDVLPTDGLATSLVTVTARDATGRPVAGLPLRGEVMAKGVSVDLGRLAPRHVVTNVAGQAHLTFTSPLISGGDDTGAVIEIAITPVGDDHVAAIRRTASIRLVPVR